ncbi:MAG: hypothetical protein IJ809_04015 [Clostridia bacterium]|nr:hypothetical protein [Clostridia bacterium]
MKVAKNVANNVVLVAVIFVFTIIIIASFFYDSSVFYTQNRLISIVCATVVLGVWYLLYFVIKKKVRVLSKKNIIIVTIIYFFIVTCIQVLVVRHFGVEPGWDFGVVYDNALKFIEEGTRINSSYKEYFEYYPNNILLFVLLITFIKLGTFIGLNAYTSAIIMNIIFIDLALLLLILTVMKKFENKYCIMAMIISLFFLPLFLYTPIFYSDTLSLFVGIGFVYLYINFEKKYNKKNIINLILVGTLLFVGKEIKITSLFIFIAILFDYIKGLNNIKEIKYLSIPFSVFLILNIFFNMFIVNNDKFNFSENVYERYPYTNWIMMGVEDIERDNSGRSAYGGYNGQDFDLTRQHQITKDEKTFNITEYIDRVKKMGFLGYLDFLTKKSVNTWTDGLYFADIALSINPKHSDSEVYQFVLKENKMTLVYFCQGVQFAFLLILIVSSVFELKNNKDIKEINYDKLAIIGLFIFFLFLENRSRYIINYIPIFILIIVTSYHNMFENRKIKLLSERVKNL